MAFEIIASTFKQKEIERSQLRRTVTMGSIAGGTALFFDFVGLTVNFMDRWIIEGVLTLAHTTMVGILVGCGALIAIRSPRLSAAGKVVQGAIVGVISAVMVSALIGLLAGFHVRDMFVALSPKLFSFLTFDFESNSAVLAVVDPNRAPMGVLLQFVLGAFLGGLGAVIVLLPGFLRRAFVTALCSAVLVGLFAELIQLTLQYDLTVSFREYFFTWEGMRLQGGITVFGLVFAGTLFWSLRGDAIMKSHGEAHHIIQRGVRYSGWAIALALFLLFPMAAGSFFGQVMMLIGLYILMGMGLNIEVGLAGLLDMGFVAFFASGAYTVALFTADNEYLLLIPGIGRPLIWWEAVPIALVVTLVMGLLFGIPVLRVRGDYLAVATLGLGEIIRLVVLSDMASPLLGGSQGLLHIPRPMVPAPWTETGLFELNDPIWLFYLTLVSSIVAGYFAWALENSRLGRAWMAVREDEDVGQALGINLINVKLLAYGLGAVFAGLAGAIFAVMLTSIFPHSFQLLISINILALIIVGGIGSLGGVVVGSAMLIGTPELLREFGEYRFLAYGAVLVIMMRMKPIGLWPSAARKRELQTLEEAEAVLQARTAQAGQRASAPAE